MLPLALGSVLPLLVIASMMVLDVENTLPLFLLHAYVTPFVGIMPNATVAYFLVRWTFVTLLVA